MITTRILTVGLDIDEPYEIYQDPENNILRALKEAYEGYCYQSCLILFIKKILTRSSCYVGFRGNDARCTIHVQFEADVVILVPGEVLIDCEVKNKQNMVLLLDHPYAAVLIKYTQDIDSFQTGRKFPIMVENVRYKLGHRKIAVSGMALMPSPKIVIFSLKHEVKLDDTERFVAAKSDLEEEMKAHKAIEKNPMYEFISKKVKDVSQDKSSEAHLADMGALINSIIETKKIKPGFYWQDPRAPKAANVYSYLPIKAQGQIEDQYATLRGQIETNIGAGSKQPRKLEMSHIDMVAAKEADDAIYAANIVLTVIKRRLMYMRLVRELFEIYGTEEGLKNNKAVFLIYQKYLLDA
jgi:hypothetical protein